jgi:hypothetical protein
MFLDGSPFFKLVGGWVPPMAWNESCIPVEVVNVKLISVIFYTK